jgi:hypothetical protein
MLLFWLVGPKTPLVWFVIGLFYGVLAVQRRSLWLGAFAVLTGNVGLWVLWNNLHLDLATHPQLWLIPPAVAALVAEYLNRDRLQPEQSAAVRYLMLGIVYVSSTADMFIAGIGNSTVLPLTLLILSLLGIFAGMALRIRSFLYLGVTFVLVVIATLLKHVTFDLEQTWVLWVCLIALGLATIALFGIFEKRRNEILAAVQRFKGWQE